VWIARLCIAALACSIILNSLSSGANWAQKQREARLKKQEATKAKGVAKKAKARESAKENAKVAAKAKAASKTTLAASLRDHGQIPPIVPKNTASAAKK